VAEPPTLACPPHHWLITEQTGGDHVQVWICHRCEARKEVSASDSEQTQQNTNAWRTGRPAAPRGAGGASRAAAGSAPRAPENESALHPPDAG
jgi:hypothetical protein